MNWIELDDAEGKTLAASSLHNGIAILRFSDDTFTTLGAERDYDDTWINNEEASLDDLARNHYHAANDAGVLSLSESERRRKEWSDRIKVETEKRERARFEELKAKFEPAKVANDSEPF